MTITTRRFELGQKLSTRLTPGFRLLNTAKASGGYNFGSLLLDEHVADPSGSDHYIPFGESGWRGVQRIEVFGNAPALATLPYAVWIIDRIENYRFADPVVAPESQYRARLLLNGVATFGAAAGSGVGIVPSTNRYPDTMTMTVSAYGAHLAAVYGRSWALFSPASGGKASVSNLDLGDPWGLYIDFNIAASTGGVLSANALVSLTV